MNKANKHNSKDKMSVSQRNWALWAWCQYLSDMFTKDIEATFSGCNFGKYQNNKNIRRKY